MSCHDCLNRREFLARSAAAAATIAGLGACGDGQIGGLTVTTPTGTTKSFKVSDFAALATVGVVVAMDDARFAKRTGTASFAAFSRSCTHEGTQVQVINPSTQEVVTSGTRLHCFNHGSEFDSNGNVTLGPAARRLEVLSTAYDPVTDMLTIG